MFVHVHVCVIAFLPVCMVCVSPTLFLSLSLSVGVSACVCGGGGAALFACKYTIHVCVSSTYQSKFYAVIKTFAKAFETFTVSETRITLSGEITTFKMSKAHLFTKPVIICSVV